MPLFTVSGNICTVDDIEYTFLVEPSGELVSFGYDNTKLFIEIVTYKADFVGKQFTVTITGNT